MIIIIFINLVQICWCMQSTNVGNWSISDSDTALCSGDCQLAMTCWMSGGKVISAGNCHRLFQVCCDYSKIEEEVLAGSRFEVIQEDSTDAPIGPVHNDPNCGKPAVAKKRVVGGKDAGFGTYPWQALIRIGSTRCGGALISHQHVVTAGHCVHSLSKKFGNFPPSGIKVYLGEYSLTGDIEPLPRQTLSVSRIYLHPHYEFSFQADRYDVAVLKLSRKIKYEPHILPICLPNRDQDLADGSTAMVAGWGSMDPDSPKRPMELQVVDVNIVESLKCEKWHNHNKIDIRIFDDMLCAGYENGGKDACQGDSGGPLMNKDLNEGRWTLIGVVSAGFSCAKPGQPGIYHKVSRSSDWITHVMEKL